VPAVPARPQVVARRLTRGASGAAYENSRSGVRRSQQVTHAESVIRSSRPAGAASSETTSAGPARVTATCRSPSPSATTSDGQGCAATLRVRIALAMVGSRQTIPERRPRLSDVGEVRGGVELA
jgi:hypothetical protein